VLAIPLLVAPQVLEQLIDRRSLLSWCDKLAATATVGFGVNYHFASIAVILDALSPMLDKWVEGDRPLFDIERREPFSVTVRSHDGYNYEIDPSRISVGFQHFMRMKIVSGGPPVAEMLSDPLPYTMLLPSVSGRLMDATSLVCQGTTRRVTRVGVVAQAMVASPDIPPGIARFIAYIGRPWKGFVDHYSFQIISDLADDSESSYRCIHTLSKLEGDPDQLVRLNFDWQRTLKNGLTVTSDSITQLTKSAEQDAIKYFEELAEGNLFDENLISAST
jgi:hypothetical protein